MNCRPQGLSLSTAFVGFEHHRAAEGLSPRTPISYVQHLRLFLEYAGGLDVTGKSLAGSTVPRVHFAWL